MKTAKINADVTDEDITLGRALGLSGTQVIDEAIHRSLDQQGVPREGRYIHATADYIEIKLPAGWELED